MGGQPSRETTPETTRETSYTVQVKHRNNVGRTYMRKWADSQPSQNSTRVQDVIGAFNVPAAFATTFPDKIVLTDHTIKNFVCEQLASAALLDSDQLRGVCCYVDTSLAWRHNGDDFNEPMVEVLVGHDDDLTSFVSMLPTIEDATMNAALRTLSNIMFNMRITDCPGFLKAIETRLATTLATLLKRPRRSAFIVEVLVTLETAVLYWPRLSLSEQIATILSLLLRESSQDIQKTIITMCWYFLGQAENLAALGTLNFMNAVGDVLSRNMDDGSLQRLGLLLMRDVLSAQVAENQETGQVRSIARARGLAAAEAFPGNDGVLVGSVGVIIASRLGEDPMSVTSTWQALVSVFILPIWRGNVVEARAHGNMSAIAVRGRLEGTALGEVTRYLQREGMGTSMHLAAAYAVALLACQNIDWYYAQQAQELDAVCDLLMYCYDHLLDTPLPMEPRACLDPKFSIVLRAVPQVVDVGSLVAFGIYAMLAIYQHGRQSDLPLENAELAALVHTRLVDLLRRMCSDVITPALTVPHTAVTPTYVAMHGAIAALPDHPFLRRTVLNILKSAPALDILSEEYHIATRLLLAGEFATPGARSQAELGVFLSTLHAPLHGCVRSGQSGTQLRYMADGYVAYALVCLEMEDNGAQVIRPALDIIDSLVIPDAGCPAGGEPLRTRLGFTHDKISRERILQSLLLSLINVEGYYSHLLATIVHLIENAPNRGPLARAICKAGPTVLERVFEDEREVGRFLQLVFDDTQGRIEPQLYF